MQTLEAAFTNRADLNQYSVAKRVLFALQLALGLEDVHSVAASALTDGPDDKSCDLIYIDRDSGRVIVAQGYEAQDSSRKQAKQTKAASLHQAINWLLVSQSESEVPTRLQSSWKELHEALEDGVISDIDIWFVHNLPESSENAKELLKVAEAANSHVNARFPGQNIKVSATEIGRNMLTDWYEASQTPILVTDALQIPITGAFEQSGDNWRALCTSLSTAWLRQQFDKYQQKLFSANIRGYLGSKQSRGNINNGIQDTMRDSPRQFWAYNNGITALVHDFEVNDDQTMVTITGLAIVNGAQTTGAIGSATDGPVDDGRLLARFIKCDDAATVQDIIRYNNRQNPTQASDFRSNDRVQARLVKEFESMGVVGYNGGRRGGAEDAIRRPGENQLSATSAAQALAAFHGRPAVAYHEKSQIWEQDALYSSIFPDSVTGQHILLLYSLLRAIEQQKQQLSLKNESDRTQDDKDLVEWFSLRGSTFLAVAAMGAICESLLDKAVADLHCLRFKPKTTINEAVSIWSPVITATLALAPSQLTKPLKSSGGLRNKEEVQSALDSFRAVVGATKKANTDIYAEFARNVISK